MHEYDDILVEAGWLGLHNQIYKATDIIHKDFSRGGGAGTVWLRWWQKILRIKVVKWKNRCSIMNKVEPGDGSRYVGKQGCKT